MIIFSIIMKLIERIEITMSALILAFMIVINMIEVICRYTLGFSISWVQETTILLAGWMTYISAGAIFKRKEDIVVEYLVNKMKPIPRFLLDAIFKVMTLLALAIIVHQGIKLYKFQIGFTNESLGIPDNIFYLPVLIGASSIFLTTVYLLINGTIDLAKRFSRNRRHAG